MSIFNNTIFNNIDDNINNINSNLVSIVNTLKLINLKLATISSNHVSLTKLTQTGFLNVNSRLSILEMKMSDVTQDLQNLVDSVTAITTDVAAILIKLTEANNITPEQVTTLETQIAALNSVDATLKAALP